ncbi:hypothetical protein [Pseudoduganella violaceinigra]|uniref:hypothetical protein n=1 Tax=Pseudoduganella violaceinigra TaxID=246602 RepID=UPI001B7F9185|nr:hypothetical protein [Pseudoduganella violaceinigra]
MEAANEKPISASNEPLDLSNEIPVEGASYSPAPYNPAPHEDRARRHIAYLLIGLLWVIVGSIFILVACHSVTVGDVKEFAVVLGPVVTLVSAATGFYYGTKSNNK